MSEAETGRGQVPGEPGIWVVIFGDLLVFGLFFCTYAVYYKAAAAIFLHGQAQLDRGIGLANTLFLLTSSLFVALATSAVQRGDGRAGRGFLSGALVCGGLFVVLKAVEWQARFASGMSVNSDDFFIFYFMLTGIHLVHVIVGLIVLLVMRGWAARPRTPQTMSAFECGALFWHLVDLLWVFLFALLYVVRP